MTEALKPLLAVGKFGTHLITAPTGVYTFVGEVPEKLSGFAGTYDEGLKAFETWFKNMSPEDKRLYAPLLRSDIFERFFNNGTFQ